MRNLSTIKTLAVVSLLTGVTAAAHAVTIAAGIASTPGASTPGAAKAGTVDSAFITAILGNNAYIQDGTGAIYAYQASKAGNPLNGLTAGTMITNLGNGSFQYYATGTQFEYETANATTLFTLGSSTPGTISSIPANYYTTVTTAQVNSTADQGSATSQGIQNQLVTLNNVVITPDPTTAVPNPSATAFTSGGTYTLTDSTGTALFYINAASGAVGAAVPTGLAKVSGVFQDFHGTSEIIPRGTYDVTAVGTAVPEPSSMAACALAAVAGVFGYRRRKA